MTNLIERFWYSNSKWLLIFWPLNLLFYLLVQAKYFLYKTKFLTSNSFSKPVIVIGNISVGGTGKTPFINQLALYLKAKGYRCGIVSRGYKSQCSHFPHQVSPSDKVELIGDEAFMQFHSLNSTSDELIPVVIDPNRSRAVNYIINNNPIDIVISDDGLQHYQMSRDIEILMFDGERQFGNKFILPFGPLREPMSRLNSVDLVVQNGNQETEYTEYKTQLSATHFVNLKTGKKHSLNYFNENSIKVNAIAAIGNPNRFYKSLSGYATIDKKRSFRDHHLFKVNDFLPYENSYIIMTEKDAAKCYEFAKENWFYLKVEMEFDNKLTQALDSLFMDNNKFKLVK